MTSRRSNNDRRQPREASVSDDGDDDGNDVTPPTSNVIGGDEVGTNADTVDDDLSPTGTTPDVAIDVGDDEATSSRVGVAQRGHNIGRDGPETNPPAVPTTTADRSFAVPMLMAAAPMHAVSDGVEIIPEATVLTSVPLFPDPPADEDEGGGEGEGGRRYATTMGAPPPGASITAQQMHQTHTQAQGGAAGTLQIHRTEGRSAAMRTDDGAPPTGERGASVQENISQQVATAQAGNPSVNAGNFPSPQQSMSLQQTMALQSDPGGHSHQQHQVNVQNIQTQLGQHTAPLLQQGMVQQQVISAPFGADLQFQQAHFQQSDPQLLMMQAASLQQQLQQIDPQVLQQAMALQGITMQPQLVTSQAGNPLDATSGLLLQQHMQFMASQQAVASHQGLVQSPHVVGWSPFQQHLSQHGMNPILSRGPMGGDSQQQQTHLSSTPEYQSATSLQQHQQSAQGSEPQGDGREDGPNRRPQRDLDDAAASSASAQTSRRSASARSQTSFHESPSSSSTRTPLGTGGGNTALSRQLPSLAGDSRNYFSNITSCVPVAASGVLLSLDRRALLPREDAAGRVVSNLLRRVFEEDGVASTIERSVRYGVPPAAAAGEQKIEISSAASDAGATEEKTEIGSFVATNEEKAEFVSTEHGDTTTEAMSFLSGTQVARGIMAGGGSGRGDDRDTSSVLFDPTSFNTVISGIGGIGKTTLAAMVVSRPDVLARFCDGIAWVQLGQKRIAGGTSSIDKNRSSYEMYCSYLRSLCKQLDLTPPSFESPVSSTSDDDEPTSGQRIATLMDNARQDMINILNGMTVLIVLDDIWHVSDVRWFSFANTPTSDLRVLITTRIHPSSGAGSGSDRLSCRDDNIIRLGDLSERDAVHLFVTEAQTAAQEVGDDPPLEEAVHHVTRVVQACKYHPVAIQSAARLLGSASSSEVAEQILKRFDSGGDSRGTEEPLQRTSNSESSLDSGLYSSLFQLLDRSFSPALHGPVLGEALKVCFVTFAILFTRTDCPRPYVPVGVIKVVFDWILLDKECLALQQDATKTSAALILERLEQLGFVDSTMSMLQRRNGSPTSSKQVTFKTYKVHHDSMLLYAFCRLKFSEALTREKLQLRFQENNVDLWRDQRKMQRTFHTSRYKSVALRRKKLKQSKNDSGRILEGLHLLLIQHYFQKTTHKSSYLWGREVADDGYVFQHLPHHMLKVRGRKMWRQTLALLQDSSYVRGRIFSMGCSDGIALHVADFESLMNRNTGKEGTEANMQVVKEEAMVVCDVVRECLDDLRFSGESSGTATKSVESIASAYTTLGVLLQRQNLWVESLDLFAEALAMYESAGHNDDNYPAALQTLLRVQGSSFPKLVLVPKDSPDCVVVKNTEDLRKSAKIVEGGADQASVSVSDLSEGVPLELSSHADLGIVLLLDWAESSTPTYDLGIGPKESAVKVVARNNELKVPGSFCKIASVSTNKLAVGDRVTLTNCGKRKTGKKLEGLFNFNFLVTEDGKVSPIGNQDLAVGVGQPSIILVPRDSPNRLILTDGRELRERKLPKVGHYASDQPGFPLALKSHPGCGILSESDSAFDLGPVRFKSLGIGSSENAIRVSYDGRVIASSTDGAVFTTCGLGGAKVGSHIVLCREKGKNFTCLKNVGSDFVINDEGSISPVDAPFLAVGCTSVGCANTVVTGKEREIARDEAKLQPKKASLAKKWHNAKFSLLLSTRFRVDKSRAEEL